MRGPASASRTRASSPATLATSGAPNEPSITLIAGAPFGGCQLINGCLVYGYSGHPANVRSCTPGVNIRTIVCAQGYYVGRTNSAEVVLTGAAPFIGCIAHPALPQPAMH